MAMCIAKGEETVFEIAEMKSFADGLVLFKGDRRENRRY